MGTFCLPTSRTYQSRNSRITYLLGFCGRNAMTSAVHHIALILFKFNARPFIAPSFTQILFAPSRKLSLPAPFAAEDALKELLPAPFPLLALRSGSKPEAFVATLYR